MMSHTGGKEGTYPGTRASATMIGDDETNWGTKSLAILDMPFTAVSLVSQAGRVLAGVQVVICSVAISAGKPGPLTVRKMRGSRVTVRAL